MVLGTKRLAMSVAAIVAACALLGGFIGSSAFAAGAGTEPSVDGGEYDDALAKANREKAKKDAKAKQLEKDLAHTEREIAEAITSLAILEDQLIEAQRERELALERLASAISEQQIVADQLSAAQAQDRAISAEITADVVEISDLESAVGALARDSYRGAGSHSQLSVVFNSSSSRQFIDQTAARHTASRAQSSALVEVKQSAAANRNRAARQEAVREYIGELKAAADALVEEAKRAQEMADTKAEAVEELLAEQRELRDFLEDKKARVLADHKQLVREYKAMETEIRSLIEGKLDHGTAGRKRDLEKGDLSFPVENPKVASHFGSRVHPIDGIWKMHYGTDFVAPCLTPVYAAGDGRVEWARVRGGLGNHMLIDHGFIRGNAVYSSYGHFAKFEVFEGEIVTRGQLIGYAGNTGKSTGCHLHFEVYVNGPAVDPMTILGYESS
jgi:murein DD-endopeptidase MepM/ murein hydrolase activator NlpD